MADFYLGGMKIANAEDVSKLFTYQVLKNGCDLNSIITFGFYKHQGGNKLLNQSPIDFAQYFVFGNGDSNNPRATQIAFGDNGQKPYFRNCGGSGWSKWSEL